MKYLSLSSSSFLISGIISSILSFVVTVCFAGNIVTFCRYSYI
ncbi:MAG: hypothetical protein Q8S84_02635 [bacterium]|nr:hypothetical protein [bacterium]